MPVSPRKENFAGGFDAINPAALLDARRGFRLRTASGKGELGDYNINELTRGGNVGIIRVRFKNVRCS